MQFNDRTTYLAATAEWKAAYAQHSAELRKHKLEFKQAQRDGSSKRENELRYLISRGKQRATEMITERHEAKQEAQAQYLESQAAKTAAAIAA